MPEAEAATLKERVVSTMTMNEWATNTHRPDGFEVSMLMSRRPRDIEAFRFAFDRLVEMI